MATKKVLIVDDSASFAEFLDATVRSAGFTPIVCSDGEEALERFRRDRADLVFLDLLLPAKDGFKVCQEMRAIEKADRRVPIVVMTGIYKKRSYQREAIDTCGADEFLVKPFAITDVWRILETHLGSGEAVAPSRETALAPVEAPPGESRVAGESRREEVRTPEPHDDGGGTLLRDRPLAGILAELRQERKTGLLFLRGGGETNVFFVESGEVVFVRSSNLNERLDRILIRAGKLREEQHRRAESLFIDSRGRARMGEILVGLGLIGEADLRAAIQVQLETLILRAFRNPGLVFTFVAGELPVDEKIRVSLPTPAIIFRGVHEMPAGTDFRSYLPGDGTVLAPTRHAEHLLAQVGMSAAERQLLGLVDGRRTLSSLLLTERLPIQNPARSLYAMFSAGMIRALSDREIEEIESAEFRGLHGRPPLPEQGDLRAWPVPVLLSRVHSEGKTGVLAMTQGDRQKWLVFREGRLVHAASDDPEHRLGTVLVAAGMMEAREIEEVLARAGADGSRRMGQVLVESGRLGMEELRWATIFQLQSIVQSCFTWGEGPWRFREGSLPGPEVGLPDTETLDLLLEGVRKLPAAILERIAPRPEAPIRRVPGSDVRADRLRFNDRERRVRAEVRGGGTVADIARRALLSIPDARRALLAQIVMGVLDAEVPPQETAREAEVIPETTRAAEPVPPAEAALEPALAPSPDEPIPLEDARVPPLPASESGFALLEELASEVEQELLTVGPAGSPIPVPPAAPVAGPAAPPRIRSTPEAPPRGIPEPGEEIPESVPRFLYERLLRERKDLEGKLLESHRRVGHLEKRLAEVSAALERLRDGIRDHREQPLPDAVGLVRILDQFLLHMGDVSRLAHEADPGEIIH